MQLKLSLANTKLHNRNEVLANILGMQYGSMSTPHEAAVDR
jgi:hypothetical protein